MISMIQSAVFAAEPYELLPVDVIYYPNHMEIRKIYEMSASVDPAKIPRAGFTRDNIRYRHTDILREVKIGEETKTLIEVETIESARNDVESILRVLPLTREVLTEDGFFGILYLNTSTLKSEIAGYGNSSSSVSVTRSYPNLYDKDTQYIPKSVTENNITYTLTDIQWQTDNRYNIDDYEIGNRFTAVATYSGTKTTSYVRGYKVTAEYIGEVCRTGVSVIRYTVIFAGTKVEQPTTEPVHATTEPELETDSELEAEVGFETETDLDSEMLSEPGDEKTSGSKWWMFLVIPLALLAAASTAGVIYMYLKNRKEQAIYEEPEENIDYDYIGNDYNDGGNDSDDGNGL